MFQRWNGKELIMAYLVKQVYNIVNDAVADALGKNATATNLDSSDIVSLGKAISEFDAYEGFFSALANRIVRTIYFVRMYEGSYRNVLRDEHEFGAFIQKVYYEMPNAVENPTWNIPNGNGQYVQASPYDVQATVGVSALIYGGKGTWSIEIVRPLEQIKTAFLDNAAMMSFIDGIYMTVENAFRVEEERIVALAVNTAMADSLSGGKARNLLAEYNMAHPSATLSVSSALESADFLKYASKEINRTMKNMSKMSTIFNKAGYNTFTSREKLVVEMLAEFASASEMYLQADTFHDELVKLPGYEEVPFWQTSGTSFAFDDCSTISITNDAFIDEDDDSSTGEVTQSGIICFLHDIENVAAYFGRRRTWELWNPRSEVMVHGEKAEKGFAVDSHANAVVFYIADNNASITGSVDSWTAAQLLGGKSASDLQSDIVVDNTNRTITGTLKYVTGYTQFSGDEAEQSGNYLAIKLQPSPTCDVYIRSRTTQEWKKMDSDYMLVLRVSNKNEQKLYVKAVYDGQENYYTYSLSGLTLNAA